MNTAGFAARAARFRDLHAAGRLLLPNAWDAASARVFELAGFPAIGTTSAGIANARGLPDGEAIGRDAMLHEISGIIDAVRVPVTADIEAGYGADPEDVARTVAMVRDLGAVGVNIEDRLHASARLFDIAGQQRRLEAARREADRHGIRLVVNARTDTCLLGLGRDPDERLAIAIERGNAYLAAGADVVFVPAAIDSDAVRKLASALDGPLNVMAVPGAPDAAALFEAGAARVSLGNMAMLAALGAVDAIAREVMTSGTWSTMERTFFGYEAAGSLFAADRARSSRGPELPA